MRRLLTAVTLLACLVAVLPARAQQRGAPAEFGEVFSAGTFGNLNSRAGGPDAIDLSRVIGKVPIVFYYWIAGNRYADEVFRELQDRVDAMGPGKLLLYGVATERPGLRADKIVAQAQALKIRVPVLNDVGFMLGTRLGVRTVPSISVLDREGRLRLANAGSLKQTLEYNMDMATALQRLAETGKLGTYGSLPKWYPVKELVGQRSPDFELRELGAADGRPWLEELDPQRLNVLVFWSVDCPHCRDSLPELSDWYRSHGKGVNLVSLARVDDEETRTKTESFRDEKALTFPIYVDQANSVSDLYKVISTPTFVLVRPDGVIDSVITSGQADVGAKLEAKRKQLAGAEGT